MAFKMKRPMIMGTPHHKHALKHVISMKEEDKHDHPHVTDEKKRNEATADPGKGRDIAYEGQKSKPIIEGDKKSDKKKDTDKKTDKKTDNKPPNAYDEAKKKDPNLDKYIRIRKDPDASEMEKAKAQDAINAAYGKGPTDRAEKLKAKEGADSKKEEPKKDSSKPAEKADTSKGTNMDKIAEGKKPEGAEKASGRMKPGDPGYMKLPESEKLKIQKAAKAKHKKALEAWRSGGRKGKRPQRKDYF